MDVLQQTSVDINQYRQHLTDCHDDVDLATILSGYELLRAESHDAAAPSFECHDCLERDHFHRLDIAALLEHSHDEQSTLFQLYLPCAECGCRVPLCDAVGHAAFWHGDRLQQSSDSLADLYLTAPPEQQPQFMSPLVTFPRHHHSASATGTTSSSSRMATKKRPLFQSDATTPPDRGSNAALVDEKQPVGGDEIAATSSRTTIESKRARRRGVQCPSCSRLFDNRKEMLAHERAMHAFACDQCAKTFAQAHILERHRLTHSPRRRPRLQCTECSAVFTQRGSLHQHERALHQGLRPYQCRLCDARFNHRQERARHERRHRGPDEVVPPSKIGRPSGASAGGSSSNGVPSSSLDDTAFLPPPDDGDDDHEPSESLVEEAASDIAIALEGDPIAAHEDDVSLM